MYNISRYYNTNSKIHSMNPTYKLLCLILFSILTIFIDNIYFLIPIYLIVSIAIILSNVPLIIYINGIKSITPFMFFIIIINIIFNVSIITTILSISKILILLLYSSVLILTTTSYSISIGLGNILRPLKIFNVDINNISKTLSLSLSFIPVVLNQSDKIMKSQASRGLDFNNGNLQDKVKSITSILFPIFLLSFRRSDKIADIMEIKSFNNFVVDKKINSNIFDKLILMFHIFLVLFYLYWRFL